MIAVSLTKIANDLALMGSGPRAGIGELFLPELQKGSSIMPGKVNPVLPEVVLQVCAQVIGNDTAITIGGLQGQFELNVRIPLIARNLLQSIHLLSTTSVLFASKCVEGIEANLEGCERSAEGTLAVATALNPFIGYDKAAEIVKDASKSGRTLREVAREHGVDDETLDKALDLRKIAAGSKASSLTALLERIDAYGDAVPRAASRVEDHGALRLFVKRGRAGPTTRGRSRAPGCPRQDDDRRGARAPARPRRARGARVDPRPAARPARRRARGAPERQAGTADGARRGPLAHAGPARRHHRAPARRRATARSPPAARSSIGFGEPGHGRRRAGPAERDASAVGQSAVELDFLSRPHPQRPHRCRPSPRTRAACWRPAATSRSAT